MRKISEMYRRSGGTDYRHLCAECKNLIKGRTCKCRAYGVTEGSETDWKPQWIACKFYNRKVSPLIRSEDREFGQTVINAARAEGWNACLDAIMEEL